MREGKKICVDDEFNLFGHAGVEAKTNGGARQYPGDEKNLVYHLKLDA